MKKLMVTLAVFFILTTGCEMRTTSKQQPSNERAMSIAGSPVYEKDYKILIYKPIIMSNLIIN